MLGLLDLTSAGASQNIVHGEHSNRISVDIMPDTATTITPEASAHTAAPWTAGRVEALLSSPFSDLIFQAQQIHRRHFEANEVQLSTLLSIKTGGCPEDCGYCPQAARYHTGVRNEELMSIEAVVDAARAAKQSGASRFCMGAAWRGPKQRDLDKVAEMVRQVKALGL